LPAGAPLPEGSNHMQHLRLLNYSSGGVISEDQWRGGAMEYDKVQPQALAQAHDPGFSA
jgi:hypothetical protein